MLCEIASHYIQLFASVAVRVHAIFNTNRSNIMNIVRACVPSLYSTATSDVYVSSDKFTENILYKRSCETSNNEYGY